jgi:hypothetical protein
MIEVALRIVVLRSKFLFANNADNRNWNWFDMFVVLASIPDFFPNQTIINISIIRVFRLARVVRILRVVHGIPVLRKMIFALLHSMSSLVPLVFLLFILLYMFALVFMQGAIADMKEMEYFSADVNSTLDDGIERRLRTKSGESSLSAAEAMASLGVYYPFRDVGAAIESLFTIVTGDGDYNLILKPIMDTHAFYKIWGIFFTVFFFFGFLNVATGLFVDKAMQISSKDRDMVLQDAQQRQKDDIHALKQLFQTADLDGDGNLTVEEMAEVIKHQDVKAWLASIDLDISEDFDAVVQVLDPQGTGQIPQEEFYRLVGRFRGPARRLETSLCLLEARHAARESHELLRRLHLTIGTRDE